MHREPMHGGLSAPLGCLLPGAIQSPDDLAEDDWRRTLPRMSGEAFQKVGRPSTCCTIRKLLSSLRQTGGHQRRLPEPPALGESGRL